MIFTTKQLKDFAEYRKIQRTTKYNMFDPRARAQTSQTGAEWVFNMNHYEQLMYAASIKHLPK